MTIVVTGGSGFIGTALCKRLLEANHTVIVVAKKAPPFTHEKLFFIHCDLETQVPPYNILERTDAVIHLVGTTIYKKWKKGTREQIKHSRIESTKRIVESIASATNRPTVLISASSIAYYGDNESPADEQSPKGAGFLPDMIESWEQEAQRAEDHGVRVVILRTAPVFGHGGLLQLLHRISRFGLLWKISRKNFNTSWVHELDIVNTYLFALETKTMQGVVNVAAPNPVREHALVRIIAKQWHRRIIGVMPRWMHRMVFGELYEELIKNQLATPQRLIDKGFAFHYTDVADAIQSLSKK